MYPTSLLHIFYKHRYLLTYFLKYSACTGTCALISELEAGIKWLLASFPSIITHMLQSLFAVGIQVQL